ncbi:MAG TPA: TIGR04283 family arsenosugar biosynthesis glycosyltransferase [Usitatibacter sp.]|jgi:rSAM/selenodomain-associated transferase 2|nr:TIGR04283 family arsenosugar biosynthesis glycosyltransferase [Usitatibacter sp.]
MLPLSIIVPALDEAAGIAGMLEALQPMRAREVEVVVVDGGSRDATRRLAAPLADRVIEAPRGRASQMNAGARASGGALLAFVHADTRLPPDAPEAIRGALSDGARAWGRFDVRIEGASPLLAVVGAAMNARSRATGIATGDQAMFARRDAFEAAGGFPDIPLMEDVALSSALKRISRPACLPQRVVTSGRRWERRGTLATVLLMWRLRLAYSLGVDPHRLARRYDVERTST